MFDIQLAPIIIFFFIFIPLLVKGGIDGWKKTLIMTGSFFIINVFWIILLIPLDEVIFPLYRKVFLSDAWSGISDAALFEFSRISFMSVMLTLLSPFSFIIMIYLTKLIIKVAKLQNWVEQVHVSEVSDESNHDNFAINSVDNSKFIVKKVKGVFAGVFLASAFSTVAVSGVSTALTSSSNKTSFETITSPYSKILTFGQASYDKTFYPAFETIKSLDGTYFGELSAFLQFDNNVSDFEQKLNNFKASEIYDDLTLKYKNNDKTKNMIIHVAIDKLYFDALSFYENSESFLESLSSLIGNNSETRISSDYLSELTSLVSSKILSFNLSPASVEYFQAKDTLSDNNKLLASKKLEQSSLEKKVISEENTINSSNAKTTEQVRLLALANAKVPVDDAAIQKIQNEIDSLSQVINTATQNKQSHEANIQNIKQEIIDLNAILITNDSDLITATGVRVAKKIDYDYSSKKILEAFKEVFSG